VSTSLADAEAWLSKRVAKHQRNRFALERVLFGPQLAFARDPATFATAICSRRAGKSVGVAAWLLEGPVLNPSAPSVYFTITRGSAKRIIWPTLLELNREHALGYVPNEADLVLKRNGVGAVYLTGVDNRNEIEKLRGTAWGRAAGDEAQTLPEYMKDLTEDVLMPSFMDHGGQLRLTGTPGSVPAGFFHGVAHSKLWGHHHWTVWENPHIPEQNKRAMLAKVLETRGVTVEHPSIRREWFGEWAFDPDALVFKFDPARNVFGGDLKSLHMVEAWQHVIGVDLGFDDADAIAVLAFNPGHPAAFLVEESVLPKQTISKLANRLQEMVAQYRPQAIVVDTGGLGKKIAEEVGSRTGLPLQPAEKARKFEFIELLNDALRSGRFYAKPGSRFASDALKLEWDREKSVGEHLVVSDKFHSDICDAVLYAFRESLHWLHREAPKEVPRGTKEWADQVQRKMFEAAQAGVQREKARKQEYELGDFGGGMDDWGGGTGEESFWGGGQ